MSAYDEESATDVPPPCPTGTCENEDACECWTCPVCDVMQTPDADAYGEGVCADCWNAYVSQCEGCGVGLLTSYPSAWRAFGGVSDNYYHTECGQVLCGDCVYVCDCGNAHCNEDEARECCADDDVVHDYSYRPTPRFWKSDGDGVAYTMRPDPHTLYVGVEIEAERAAGTADRFLADADEEAGDEQYVYLKRDGSLGDGGVELVTHPATVDAFLRRFPFAAVEQWTARGARSYARQSCGFHIHVSRSGFTRPHLWRFVRFQLANVQHCVRMAQRESQQWAEWSGDGMDEVKKHLPAMVKGEKANGRRYVAINFQNRNTVELRYFKGNLSPRIIRRQVLFVGAMHAYTQNMTLADMRNGGMEWDAFVRFCDADARYSTLVPDLTA